MLEKYCDNKVKFLTKTEEIQCCKIFSYFLNIIKLFILIF